MNTLTTVVSNIPFFYPMLGAAIALLLFNMSLFVFTWITVLFQDLWNSPADLSGLEKSATQNTINQAMIVYYTPGYGYGCIQPPPIANIVFAGTSWARINS